MINLEDYIFFLNKGQQTELFARDDCKKYKL